jgi:hypothetical protein
MAASQITNAVQATQVTNATHTITRADMQQSRDAETLLRNTVGTVEQGVMACDSKWKTALGDKVAVPYGIGPPNITQTKCSEYIVS